MSAMKRHVMVHPGPRHHERIQWYSSRVALHAGKTGESGATLSDALAAMAKAHGATSGVGTFHNVHLRQTHFTTGGPARDGKAANYTWIRAFETAYLPYGTFTFGADQSGGWFVHCHAAIESPHLSHRSGGHLFPVDCIVDGRFDVEITSLPDVSLIQEPDAETLHSVFEPKGANEKGNALFIRPRPNEDITEAVEAACRSAGMLKGTVQPSIGSLNAPSLKTDDGVVAHSSVGMEVISLTGTVQNGFARLNSMVCDEAGRLYEGLLERGQASICVTAEIVVLDDQARGAPVAS